MNRPKLFRQIGTQHWNAQIENMKKTGQNYCIVSCHYSGWVYIIQKANSGVTYLCKTYKLHCDPLLIEKELYNYTIINGNLINSMVVMGV